MTDSRNTARPRRRKTVRRAALVSLLGAFALLGWLLRGCLGIGLGPGGGTGETASDTHPGPDARDQPVDARPPAPARCELHLSSSGLTLAGTPIDVPAAVDTCKHASEVSLRVTGGARSGTYDEIKRAFEQADIPLRIDDSP